jgi:hypothetical protein
MQVILGQGMKHRVYQAVGGGRSEVLVIDVSPTESTQSMFLLKMHGKGAEMFMAERIAE